MCPSVQQIKSSPQIKLNFVNYAGNLVSGAPLFETPPSQPSLHQQWYSRVPIFL